MSELAKQINAIRTGHHLSLAAFGRKLDVTGQCISLIESDKRKPSISILEKIAQMYCLKLSIGFTFQNGEWI